MNEANQLPHLRILVRSFTNTGGQILEPIIGTSISALSNSLVPRRWAFTGQDPDENLRNVLDGTAYLASPYSVPKNGETISMTARQKETRRRRLTSLSCQIAHIKLPLFC